MKWNFFRIYQDNWKEVAFGVGCQSGQQDEITEENRHLTAIFAGHVCRKKFEEDELPDSKRLGMALFIDSKRTEKSPKQFKVVNRQQSLRAFCSVGFI